MKRWWQCKKYKIPSPNC